MFAPTVVSVLIAYLQVRLNIFSKKSGIPTELVVVGTTLLIGLLYVAFTEFAPVEVQTSAIDFVKRIFIIQWALWEFWVKRGQA
jgi:hypothetical protein